jgi:outer membrane protein
VGAPLISASYGRLFLGPFGIAYVAAHWDNFYVGPLLGYMPGRPQDADAHLEGLGDIPSSFAAGAFGLYHLGHFVVTAAVEQAVNHTGNGLVGLVQFSYQTVLMPKTLDMTIGPVTQFGDRAHEETFFGVTPAQSEQSGLAQFTPGAGVTDVGVQLNFNYHYSRHVLFRAFANAKELMGSAADSPIVERRLQTLLGAGVAYRF